MKCKVIVRFFDSQKSKMFFEDEVHEVPAEDIKRYEKLKIFDPAYPKLVTLEAEKAEKKAEKAE